MELVFQRKIKISFLIAFIEWINLVQEVKAVMDSDYLLLKKIIQLNGGSIKIKSEINKGTTFKIIF